MLTDNVKGFRDIEDASKRAKIRRIFEDTFRLYGFQSVETPIIEYEEFVKGENPNDEAVSDIFKLKDKGNRRLALRYELTFQLKRLSKNKKLPYKRYEIGPVFRDEPITGNRWRQFTQCDADIIGASLKDIAEILKLTSEILNKLKIKPIININNRKLINEILDELKIKNKDREKVIREIDKLDKQPESEIKKNLKKLKAEKILQILKKPRKSFEKYKAYQDIKELEKIASQYKLKLNFQPFLARGLAYYNWIVFEVKADSKENIKETITAGGSYLANNIQSAGISFGLDRLTPIAKLPDKDKKALIISFGQDKKALALTEKLRKQNIATEIMYNKPGKALEYADSKQILNVIFIGDKEVKAKKLKLRNMASGKEKMISEKQLEKEIK